MRRDLDVSDRKYSVLFGFHGKNDMDTVGFVKVIGGDFSIVDDIRDATLYENENYSDKSGWGSPEQWKDYANEEMKPWKFHVVKTCLKKEED